MPQSFKAFHLGENLLGSGWQKQTITTTAKIDERATTQIDERGALYVFLHYQRANRESSSEHGIVGRCCSGSFSSSNLGRNSWFVHYWVCTKELKLTFLSNSFWNLDNNRCVVHSWVCTKELKSAFLSNYEKDVTAINSNTIRICNS